MAIKLVVGGFTLNIISLRAQVGLDEGEGDFNGHIGSVSRGYDEVHGGFGFGDRNGGGVSLLNFAKAFGLVVANSSFPKTEEHLVTFRTSVAATQIDFLLLRKDDKGLCKDCKVIPSENLTTQHKLRVMDLEIKRRKKKRAMDDRPRIRWGSLTPASALEMGEKLMAMGAWDSRGMRRVCGIGRPVALGNREILGVSRPP
ncbi:uncharacterized protein LOC132034863 [Lycium ferocissimum]|uniref:uncharacterized protein LOC132034863 n=1 Tax=Lycium ferocissimum TaxID=112874 RepID=UPI00281614EF|nr:uncharacterized protein LOC132034863 [Lycium ferocissimum]